MRLERLIYTSENRNAYQAAGPIRQPAPQVAPQALSTQSTVGQQASLSAQPQTSIQSSAQSHSGPQPTPEVRRISVSHSITVQTPDEPDTPLNQALATQPSHVVPQRMVRQSIPSVSQHPTSVSNHTSAADASDGVQIVHVRQRNSTKRSHLLEQEPMKSPAALAHPQSHAQQHFTPSPQLQPQLQSQPQPQPKPRQQSQPDFRTVAQQPQVQPVAQRQPQAQSQYHSHPQYNASKETDREDQITSTGQARLQNFTSLVAQQTGRMVAASTVPVEWAVVPRFQALRRFGNFLRKGKTVRVMMSTALFAVGLGVGVVLVSVTGTRHLPLDSQSAKATAGHVTQAAQPETTSEASSPSQLSVGDDILASGTDKPGVVDAVQTMAAPTTISIPAAAISAKIAPSENGPDGMIDAITDYAKAAWYSGANEDVVGKAQFIGGYSTDRSGKAAALDGVDKIAKGQTIKLTLADGTTRNYEVSFLQTVDKAKFVPSAMLTSDSPSKKGINIAIYNYVAGSTTKQTVSVINAVQK